MKKYNANVLIIGTGPAGMAAALELSKLKVKNIIIVDRDKQAGGLPHLTNHIGFGIRDIHRVLSGPSYAKNYLKKLSNTQIKLFTETTVTGWLNNNTVSITTPDGLGEITAKAILLSTGCRERPRSARLIPGLRPQGIFNTGSLQDFVNYYGKPVGKYAAIIGSELVSYSAIHTLKKSGCKPIVMTTEFSKPQIPKYYLPFKWWSSNPFNKVPLETNVKLTDIYGKNRVEGIELTNLKTGNKKRITCDTIILTGDWIPDNEMARLGNIEINNNTKGPAIDGYLRTSRKGVFAAGNLLRGAEPSDIAALEGKYVAKYINNFLTNSKWFTNRISIIIDNPIKWISPNAIEPDSYNLPRDTFLFRVNNFISNKILEVKQGNKILFSQKYKNLIPNYSFKLNGKWLSKVQETEPIKISIK